MSTLLGLGILQRGVGCAHAPSQLQLQLCACGVVPFFLCQTACPELHVEFGGGGRVSVQNVALAFVPYGAPSRVFRLGSETHAGTGDRSATISPHVRAPIWSAPINRGPATPQQKENAHLGHAPCSRLPLAKQLTLHSAIFSFGGEEGGGGKGGCTGAMYGHTGSLVWERGHPEAVLTSAGPKGLGSGGLLHEPEVAARHHVRGVS